MQDTEQKHNYKPIIDSYGTLPNFGRKNCIITAYDRAKLALRLKPVIADKAKENQIRSAENRVRQISDKQEISTKHELAKLAGVSHDTIAKVEKIEAKAVPENSQSIYFPAATA